MTRRATVAVLSLLLLSACAETPAERPDTPPAEQAAASAGSSCVRKPEAAAATTTAAFEDKGKGIALRLPYNPAWGEAYEEDGEDVLFGAPVTGPGCTPTRRFRMRFLPAKDAPAVAAEAKAALQESLGGEKIEMGSEPQVVPLGDLTVVESLVLGSCRTAALEIVGRKGNVRISYCGQGTKRAEDMKPLRVIAKTAKFL